MKTAHDSKNTNNVVVVVNKGVLRWIKDNITVISIESYTVAGIYRLSWISKEQFNVSIRGNGYSVHPVMLIFDNRYSMSPVAFIAVNDKVLRAKIAWCLEFVAPLALEELTPGFD